MGGSFYKDVVKIEFNHPFFWGQITPPLDIIKLINEFETINFDNYTLEKDKDWKFTLNIDNKIHYFLTHYIFSKTDTIPRKFLCEVYYNKIWEYIIEKYESRLQRMKQCKDKPCFAIHWSLKYELDEIKLDEFIKNSFKYKTIIFMPFNKYKNYEKENLKLIFDESVNNEDAFFKLAFKYKTELLKLGE